LVKVLIPTKPDDAHAIFVKLALEIKGHEGVIWYTSDFPEQQTHSFSIINNHLNWNSLGADFKIDNDCFDVVWLRRPRKPLIPNSIHPDDIENAVHENNMFFQTFWQVIAPDALWINPVNNAKIVSCKLLQLKIASEVGLKTPETLVSNDPLKIKEFIQVFNKDRVIYKTLYPLFWLNEKEMRLTYTKEVTLDDLPLDSTLQSTPGIFQRKILKSYELRLTFFGDYVVPVKIHSQVHPKGILDWRHVPTHELVVEKIELPTVIYNSCRKFMKHFGIVFGAFDFIVTPENEYYFLEINEQGQFLWIEDIDPTIKMLDIFTDYLINRNQSYIWKESSNSVSIARFYEKMNVLKENAIKVHKNPGIY